MLITMPVTILTLYLFGAGLIGTVMVEIVRQDATRNWTSYVAATLITVFWPLTLIAYIVKLIQDIY